MVHSSSVDIRPEWAVVEQIPFTSLSKLNYQVSALSFVMQQGPSSSADGINTSTAALLPLSAAACSYTDEKQGEQRDTNLT